MSVILRLGVVRNLERASNRLDELSVPGREPDPIEVRALLAEMWLITEQLEDIAESLRPPSQREREYLERQTRRHRESKIARAIRVLVR